MPVLCQIVRPSSSSSTTIGHAACFSVPCELLFGATDAFFPRRLEMDSASAWPCGHDGHLEPAICLDAVRQTVPGRDRRGAAHRSDHLLGADRPADAVFARPRMARRSVRAEGADRLGRSADRAWVGALGFRRQHLDVVPDLRGPVRGRHRHRLCRRRRLDGEMVSGPARDSRSGSWRPATEWAPCSRHFPSPPCSPHPARRGP